MSARPVISSSGNGTKLSHDLALQGGRTLAKILGTQVMDPKGDLTLNMVRSQPSACAIEFLNVRVGEHIAPSPRIHADDQEIRRKYPRQGAQLQSIFAVLLHNGGRWTCCSDQVWNEVYLEHLSSEKPRPAVILLIRRKGSWKETHTIPFAFESHENQRRKISAELDSENIWIVMILSRFYHGSLYRSDS